MASIDTIDPFSLCYNFDPIKPRIYQQRHTPQKENGDTVLQNRGSGDTFGKFDTSQSGEVTNAMSHVTTALFSQPPPPSTIGHEDPPLRSRNGDDCPPTSTGAQHHHRRTAMMAPHEL